MQNSPIPSASYRTHLHQRQSNSSVERILRRHCGDFVSPSSVHSAFTTQPINSLRASNIGTFTQVPPALSITVSAESLARRFQNSNLQPNFLELDFINLMRNEFRNSRFFRIGDALSSTIIRCEPAIDAFGCCAFFPEYLAISTSGVRPTPRWLSELIARDYTIHPNQ